VVSCKIIGANAAFHFLSTVNKCHIRIVIITDAIHYNRDFAKFGIFYGNIIPQIELRDSFELLRLNPESQEILSAILSFNNYDQYTALRCSIPCIVLCHSLAMYT